MNEKLTVRAVAPIELPPPPEPRPQDDPISAAAIAEVAEKGYEGATAASVVRRAEVSLEQFEQRFDGLDACLIDSLERMVADYKLRVGRAFNAQRDWPTALRAAAYATAEWMDENPTMVIFGIVEVLKMPDEIVRVRREEAFAFCSRMIDRGRAAAPDPDAVPDSAATFAIGAITQLLTHRLQESADVEPASVIPEMMARIVHIYLGAEAAEAEWTAERPGVEQPLGEG